jgi:MFS family permease
VARLLLGIAEAPGMIGNQKATGLWFPTHERSRSTAIFDSAAKFANVIGVPIVAFFVVGFGWRWGFAVTALLSFAYFVAYFLAYRDPSQDSHLSREEHAYILAGGATPEGQPVGGQGKMLLYVLGRRKVWAHVVGYSAYGYSFYLFLTWLPGYLVDSLHMSILKSAGILTIPWIFASLADLLLGGFLVDYLIGRGFDETKVRKVAIACGMACGLAVFGAAYTTDPFWALTWITISLSGLSAAAPVASSIVSLISPRGAAATVGGIVNLVNNLMGVAAPVITGFIVGRTHSFAGAFLVAGLVLIVGIFSYLVVLGRIEPIPDPPAMVPATA